VPLIQQSLNQSILSYLAHAGRLFIILAFLAGNLTHAGNAELAQARQIHDRLTGIPPTNTVLSQMESAIINDTEAGAEAAANIAMLNPAFYNVTLKNYIAPWTNEDQSVFVDLNDYTATVIGIIRDDIDFRQILSGDIIYTANGTASPSYSNSSNDHYVALEALGPVAGDLSDENILVGTEQSSFGNLPAGATAGIMTTRAAAQAFFSDGTNRAMFRFTLMNHLCTDLEPLKDISRVPDRVRQDTSRSPGGDSRIFMYSCVGCHAGMDGLTGAYAKYNFDTSVESGSLAYNLPETPNDTSLNGFSANGISNKYHVNAENFKPGYITTDDSWINYWRSGQNELLGWSSSAPAGVTIDSRERFSTGNGAKSMGAELANSRAFASCQVKKAFKAICFRDSNNYAVDRQKVSDITDGFMSGYNMKSVFGKVAAYCSQ